MTIHLKLSLDQLNKLRMKLARILLDALVPTIEAHSKKEDPNNSDGVK